MSFRSIFKPALFQGKTIIVTGAGSGIGRCTAHELSSLDAKVILIGRNTDKLQAVSNEIATAYNSKPHYYSCDIRDEGAVKNTIQSILAQYPAIDGLVNNAGGQFPSPLADISLNGWNAVVSNNLTGGFLL